MLPAQKDSLTTQAALTDREVLINAILGMDCDFPVDLTTDYLEGLTTKKLRHVHTALCAQAGKHAAPPTS